MGDVEVSQSPLTQGEASNTPALLGAGPPSPSTMTPPVWEVGPAQGSDLLLQEATQAFFISWGPVPWPSRQPGPPHLDSPHRGCAQERPARTCSAASQGAPGEPLTAPPPPQSRTQHPPRGTKSETSASALPSACLSSWSGPQLQAQTAQGQSGLSLLWGPLNLEVEAHMSGLHYIKALRNGSPAPSTSGKLRHGVGTWLPHASVAIWGVGGALRPHSRTGPAQTPSVRSLSPALPAPPLVCGKNQSPWCGRPTVWQTDGPQADLKSGSA